MDIAMLTKFFMWCTYQVKQFVIFLIKARLTWGQNFVYKNMTTKDFKKITCLNCLPVLLSVVFLAASPVNAAHFVKVDEQVIYNEHKNGQLISSEDYLTMHHITLSPSEVVMEVNTRASCETAEYLPDCTIANLGIFLEEFIIEPEEDEDYGDCVMVRYNYDGHASVSYQDQASASAGLGGGENFPDYVLTAEEDPLTVVAELDYEHPAQILLVQKNGKRFFTYGPEIISVNGDSISPVHSGEFMVRIGDTIRFEISAAAIGAAVHPGEFSAEASASMNASLKTIDCPTIPTMTEWGLIIMAVLFVFCALYMRRRGHI